MTYEEIDALRLKAFRTNNDADRKAYFDAASKWFQDDIYRRMDHERELATLRAENERLRTLIERAGHKFGKCANLIDEASSRTATQNMSRVEYANLCAAECKEALK